MTASDSGQAGPAEPGGEAAQAEAPGLEAAGDAVPPSPPMVRGLRWLRRASLRVRIAAVVAAAVIAAVVFVAVPSSSSPPPTYATTSLPAPCALIGLATLAKYLPNPTGTPISVLPASIYKKGSCEWSSTAGSEERTVAADVVVFSSSNGSNGAPNATGEARQFYSDSLSVLDCHSHRRAGVRRA